MPLYTFYAYIGYHGAKIQIHTIEHFPHDWIELKELLLDCARKAFNDYGTIEALWSLERHVTTQFKVWRPRAGTYIYKPFNPKRNIEATFIIHYNHKSDSIVVRQASFIPQHQTIAQEYKAIEKGVKYEIKPLLPKTQKTFAENPKLILQQPSTTRYPDYSKPYNPKYAKNLEGRHAPARTYLPWGQRVRETR